MNRMSFQKAGLRPVIVFKRWGRKGYSLFRVLKKIVVIAVIPVAYHTSAKAVEPSVRNDTSKVTMHVGLDEIEVSAQRAPVTFSQAARIVTVITKDEIEAAAVESIPELLEYAQSVDIRQRGGQGVQADVSIRGSSFDQVMILLNGVDITDPQTGHHDLNLPVSINQIQRVEIIEGPASRVFGPNAFAGAINFRTTVPLNNQLSAQASVGQYGYTDANLSGAIRKGNVGQYLSGGRKSSSGYIDDTDFENYNFFYNLDAGAARQFSLQIGYTAKSFGANSFYTPEYPDQYEQTRTMFSSLKWIPKGKLHFSPVVYWRRQTDKFELFRNQAPDWYTSHNYHLTNVYGVNLNAWVQSLLGKTAFGANLRSDNILSNTLGKPINKPIDVKHADAQYTKSDSRNTYSLFFEQSLLKGNWAVSAGIMANYITGSDLGINFFPGLDLAYGLTKNLKVYGSVNRSLRMPTFTDLYYSDPANVGNPALKPETANSLEGGFKYVAEKLTGNLTWFYRDGKNIIDWVKLPDEVVWHAENLTHLVSSGVEFRVDYYPEITKSHSFITRIGSGYMYNNQTKSSYMFDSKYALDNLKHKFEATVSHRILKNLSATWALDIQDRNGTYTQYTDGSYGKEVTYKTFALVDGKLNYIYKLVNLYLSVSNLFNVTYYDIGNVVQPGRWIKAGLRFNINFKSGSL